MKKNKLKNLLQQAKERIDYWCKKVVEEHNKVESLQQLVDQTTKKCEGFIDKAANAMDENRKLVEQKDFWQQRFKDEEKRGLEQFERNNLLSAENMEQSNKINELHGLINQMDQTNANQERELDRLRRGWDEWGVELDAQKKHAIRLKNQNIRILEQNRILRMRYEYHKKAHYDIINRLKPLISG